MTVAEFASTRPFGFITEGDVPDLMRINPLCLVLVRCGGGRFICAVQDLYHLKSCVLAGGDYVRDLSIYKGNGFPV